MGVDSRTVVINKIDNEYVELTIKTKRKSNYFGKESFGASLKLPKKKFYNYYKRGKIKLLNIYINDNFEIADNYSDNFKERIEKVKRFYSKLQMIGGINVSISTSAQHDHIKLIISGLKSGIKTLKIPEEVDYLEFRNTEEWSEDVEKVVWSNSQYSIAHMFSGWRSNRLDLSEFDTHNTKSFDGFISDSSIKELDIRNIDKKIKSYEIKTHACLQRVYCNSINRHLIDNNDIYENKIEIIVVE